MKRARRQDTHTRVAYAQGGWVGGGIKLNDLRDLVAATEDFDEHSHVKLEHSTITITETKSTRWADAGRSGTEQ